MTQHPSGRAGRAGRAVEDPRRELVALLQGMRPRWSVRDVFADFIELSSLSISNAVDKAQFDTREARYLDIAKKYPREEFERFPRMLACLTLAMEQCCAQGEFEDVLGGLYMTLELGNDRAGQVFTPFHVSQLMARVIVGDAAAAKAEVEAKGFVDVMEPACGAGGMVIAMADALHAVQLNYQQVMHATCVDIDLRCVHMAFLQLALLHVPAVVVHGNSLSGEVWSRWHTPAHVLGGWRHRLQRHYANREATGRMAHPATGASTEAPSQHAADGLDEASPATSPADAAGTASQLSRENAQRLLFGSDDTSGAAWPPQGGVADAGRRGKLGQGGESRRHTDETPPSS
ncbi:hypothetical protein DelCs14_1799 [Delftia sp. Cs1-4]|uniref:N-6 DNA methylase n=1 Tax=Delftia sp. (strain Cs1-4) TaxID=742013 RepID=UPI00020E7BE9|nr:N-6 DNA methylase [Delftia sp. Cs1-4]AEF88824.1 hypothetical protein DelCs14_1799 [Delftia sp. Cs1-4]